MDIIKERQIIDFLNLHNKDLLRYYNNSSKEIQKMMSNLYTACYRFNLNNVQTNHILEEATRPFKNNILLSVFGDDENA